ncbi:hypothetical protein [Brevundimonas sp.]|uniref:hypothetical protein n=1 Tax=Brevundimonas sp. TaxID=1871086 RepID=UPI002AB8BA27|nr:hypothetical protein [Brevundimonas sp.]MDZ4362551.1 hypothetical protein [Brevundimonas sp.]
MKRLWLVILGLTAAACATVPPGPSTGTTGCDVEVRFGSYAMSVDPDLKRRILSIVQNDPGVETSTETPWGREGESTLCVDLDSAAATDRLYGRIEAVIPPYSDRAPTTVIHRDGRSHSAVMPGGSQP